MKKGRDSDIALGSFGCEHGEACPGCVPFRAPPISAACGADLTDRDARHETSVCLLVAGHPESHYDPKTLTSWTDKDHYPGSPGKIQREEDVELDSPNFVSQASKDFAARGFQRINTPRK